MTDEQIIKALECCYIGTAYICLACPYSETDDEHCEDELHKSAFELINRQKAEIEQWKEESNRWQNAFCKSNEDIETAKSEAIKEFAERLCKGRGKNDPVVIAVKSELKRMASELKRMKRG